MEADVKSIPEACDLVAKETGWDVKELRGCIFCVNGKMNSKISELWIFLNLRQCFVCY